MSRNTDDPLYDVAQAEQALLALPEAAMPSSKAEPPLLLSVDELLPDAGGEVVLQDVSGGLLVFEGATVTACGTAASGRQTADGIAVGGLSYAHFDNGVTLYYDPAAQIAFQHG